MNEDIFMDSKKSTPDGWEAIKLGDIIELEYGKGLTKKSRDSSGDFPVYGSSGLVGYHNEYLIEGPVIIVGRKGGVGLTWLSRENCWPIDTTYFVRENSNLYVKFVFYLLRKLDLGQYDKSTAIPELSRNDAYNLVVWIPSLSEQHRIVDKIEELFSDLDKGIESLKTAQVQLKIYRQAVLKWAFEGKLTAQWREDQKRQGQLESAEDLLERIRAEREQRYQKELEIWEAEVKAWEANGKDGKRPKKPKKPHRPTLTQDDIEELSSLPIGWLWVFPEEICAPDDYSLAIGPFGSNLKVEDYRESGKPLVFVRNITSGNFDLNLKYVSHAKFSELLAHSVKPLDLLITKMGDPPGDCEIYPSGREDAIITADCLKFRVWSEYASRKLYKYCINSNLIKKQLGLITQGVAQKKISLERFKSLKFPLPPFPEQDQIVEEIESRLSLCDQLEADIEENLRRSEALRQSILKQAFEGKLVPQDPNDEPASVLLERIRSERQGSNPKPSKKRPKTQAQQLSLISDPSDSE